MIACTHITIYSTAVPEHLWSEFQNHSLSVLRQLPPDDERLKEIPPQFYAAFPLDNASKTRGTAGSFGYPSETYKVHFIFQWELLVDNLYGVCRMGEGGGRGCVCFERA